MRFNSLIFLALLSCIHIELCAASSNQATLKAVPVIESVTMSSDDNDDVQRNSPAESNKSNIQFTDLIEDVQYLILYEMNFTELVQMAQTNNRFNSIAKDVFSHKYRDYSIEIRTIKHGIANCYCDNTFKIILIKELQLITNVLRLFGNRIKTLAIVNRFIDDNLSTAINKLVNVYASRSVSNLDLSYIKEDTLEQFTEPFSEVQTSNLAVFIENITGNIMPFNQLFPKLISLSMVLAHDLDYHFIDVTYPYLKHIEIHVHEFSDKRKKHIESLFRKNNQIQSVTTWNFPVDYVITINKMFPHLEKLSIRDFEDIHQTLYFDHVKEFRLASFEVGCLNKLLFKNLQSFDMYYDEFFVDEQKQFFKINQNITKLTIEIFSYSIDDNFIQLIDELPNLREIKMQSIVNSIDPEIITKIIQSHEKLMKAEFSSYRKYDKSAVEYFPELLEQWHVNEEFNRRGFMFGKRILD